MSLADAPIFTLAIILSMMYRGWPHWTGCYSIWRVLMAQLPASGACNIGLQPGHTLITYPISQEINVTLKSICFLSNKWLRLYRTPISTAAALEFGWPFSQELCVAYAMIMSTAGTYQSVSFIRKRFYVRTMSFTNVLYRNRIDHHSNGFGDLALPARRMLPGQT
jgi:hypothetical protein